MNKLHLIVAVALASAGGHLASAATIDWTSGLNGAGTGAMDITNSVTNIGGTNVSNDISFQGTYVSGLNFGSATATDNGATFYPAVYTGADGGHTVYSETGANTDPITLSPGAIIQSDYGAYNPGFQDPNYYGVIGHLAYNAAQAVPLTITLNGLNTQDSYQVQIWVHQPYSTNGAGILDGPTLLGDASGTHSGSNGQFATGVFNADATSQTITLDNPDGFGNIIVSAIQLRDLGPAVPEPSSVMLLSLGALGMLRRKSRGPVAHH